METKPDLDDLVILCAVVDSGSFRAAADRVGTSQPTVSRAITRLESRLDQPLFRRNSRSVAPTQLGLRYAAHARELLRNFDDFEAELRGGGQLAGPLTVSAPPELGRRLFAATLADFAAANPEVRLDVAFENRRVDLVEESVDVAIRLGPLQPTWNRQRSLVRGQLHVYAAPSFGHLRGAGSATVVDQAPCLVLKSTHLRDRWPFLDAGEPVWRTVTPTLTSSDAGSLILFATAGLGATLMPDFLVRDEVERGELVQLTTSEEVIPAEVFAVTTQHRRSARVEALLEHLTRSKSQFRG